MHGWHGRAGRAVSHRSWYLKGRRSRWSNANLHAHEHEQRPNEPGTSSLLLCSGACKPRSYFMSGG